VFQKGTHSSMGNPFILMQPGLKFWLLPGSMLVLVNDQEKAQNLGTAFPVNV
jgi:hypothetical protein